jgi:hypothetical protein
LLPRKRKIARDVAERLLTPAPRDRGFSFYLGVDMPAGRHASNLREFSDRLLEVEPRSIFFHLERDDFQKWLVEVIGDRQLASKLSRLKGSELSPEDLRSRVYSEVKARCDELSAAIT